MTAPRYEARPPTVEALRWTPRAIGTVGRVIAWLEFAGADPVIDGWIGSAAILRIGGWGPERQGRLHVQPGEWIVHDPARGAWWIKTADEFEQQFREATP